MIGRENSKMEIKEEEGLDQINKNVFRYEYHPTNT